MRIRRRALPVFVCLSILLSLFSPPASAELGDASWGPITLHQGKAPADQPGLGARLRQAAAPLFTTDPLDDARQRALDAGSYRFDAEIRQTMIPRALPELAGQREERVDWNAEGQVRPPDKARTTIWFQGGEPIHLIQDGERTFLQEGDELSEIHSPTDLVAPQADFLAYLEAARDVRELEPQAAGGVTYRRYGFEIDGPRFAQQVRDQIARQLEPDMPEGAQIAPPRVFELMTGSGVLWIDEAGLPRRQTLDLRFTEISPAYDARLRIETDFRNYGDAPAFPGVIKQDGSWRLDEQPVAPAASEGTPVRLPRLSIATQDVVLVLVLWLILAVIAAYRRHPKPVYAGIAITVLVLMLATPWLQAWQWVRFDQRLAQAAEATSLADALPGTATSTADANPAALGAADVATDPAAPDAGLDKRSVRLYSNLGDGDVITTCGDGSPDEDTDGDGLNDYDESCLGTDAYEVDTDGDLITDTIELDGFTWAGQQWYSDPFKIDSNSDGLPDVVEWPAPIGDAGDGDDAWDPDGDGVPNLWDEDNDDDGVPDAVDFSPFGRGDYLTDFSFETWDTTPEGYRYIEIQVQPENHAHLRYSTTALDWPDDDVDGQVTSPITGSEDIKLIPFLDVATHGHQAPDQALREKYGVTLLQEEGQGARLLLPLFPQRVNGKVTNFYAKVAFDPADTGHIQWWDGRLVWLVQSLGEDRDYSIIHQYTEPFRVTGLQITESNGYELGVYATPDSPTEDASLFNLVFGMSMTFLDYIALEGQSPLNTGLEEIKARFDAPNTPLTYTWGVTEAVASSVVAYDHQDHALAESTTQIADFLDAHLARSTDLCTDDEGAAFECATVALGVEERLAVTTVEALGGAAIEIDTSAMELLTKRAVRVQMYGRTGASWYTMDLAQTLAIMEQRYAGQWDDIIAPFLDDYPLLIPEDARFATYLAYQSWYNGRTSTVAYGDMDLVMEAPDESDLFANLQTVRLKVVKLGNYILGTLKLHQKINVTRANLAELSDLEGLAAMESWDDFNKQSSTLRSQKWKMRIMGVGQAVFGVAAVAASVATLACGETGECNELALDIANKTIGFVGVAFGIADVVLTLRALSNTIKSGEKVMSTFKAASKCGKALAIVGLIIQVALIWTQFGLTVAGNDNDSAFIFDQALGTAIAATVWAIIFFVLMCIPVVDIIFGIIILVIVLIDLILSFFTDFSIMGAMVSFFYKAEMVTDVESAEFLGGGSGLVRESDGFVVGNRFEIWDTFKAVITGSKEADNCNAHASWSPSSNAAGVVAGHGWRDSTETLLDWDTRKVVQNDVHAAFDFLRPKKNALLDVDSTASFELRYKECTLLGICWHDTDSQDVTDSFSMTIDILPNSLTGLWTWSTLDNPDPDGDGLLAAAEDSAGTDEQSWDTDGDGLSDRFEVANADTLGLDPLNPDTDGDGLLDGVEVRVGTNAADQDSDDDGLSDADEVYHRDGSGFWTGGWEVRSLSGPNRWVFSDPLHADIDNDSMSDAKERDNHTSPYGKHIVPTVRGSADPLGAAPNGARALYLLPGDPVDVALRMVNTGGAPVTTTLHICLPDHLTDVTITGTTANKSTPPPARSYPCGNGTGFQWEFGQMSGDSRPYKLPLGGDMEVILSAKAGSSSASGVMDYGLPFRDKNVGGTIDVVVDDDDPETWFTAPADGDILTGETYIIGGYAQDASTWVDAVDLYIDTNGGAGVAYGAAEAIAQPSGLWAHGWDLPADGQYGLRAQAQDGLGHTSDLAEIGVWVDNTRPQVTLNAPTVADSAVTVAGTASDNLTGLAKVQVSVDDGPWREVAMDPAGGYPTNATWSYAWSVNAGAQGEHTVAVRSLDRAGHLSDVAETGFVIDVAPPSDDLLTRLYEETPLINASDGVTLTGYANDAGNVPLPPRPAALHGEIDPLADATVWLSAPSIHEDDDGVALTWAGDLDGDGRGDLAVGWPAAQGGAGQIAILYGHYGDWVLPPDADPLEDPASDARASFVGVDGAGLGAHLAAAGDVDGDGIDDLLVGDPANGRATLVFGKPFALGHGLTLDGGQSGRRVGFARTDSKSVGDWVAPAGDVNGDGLSDFLIGSDHDDLAYLILGHTWPWFERYDVRSEAAATIMLPPAGRALGVGDVDGDGEDDLAVVDADGVWADGEGVYLLGGTAAYTRRAKQAIDPRTDGSKMAFFGSAGLTATQAAPLGDVDGDGLADFAYGSGSTPQLVLGRTSNDWSAAFGFSGYSPAPDGLIAGVGDVDRDGLDDILLGHTGGGAYLILGRATWSGQPEPQAVFSGVAGAASAPYAAGADVNCDGSSELALLPAQAGVTQLMNAARPFGHGAAVNQRALPVARGAGAGDGPAATGARGAALAASVAATNRYVDDDDLCGGQALCYTTIQDAIDAAATGDTITVYPGVYGAFAIGAGLDGLTVQGVNPDAVFVDGGGGNQVVAMSDVAGVTLSQLTLRNADALIALDGAGTDGANDPDRVNELDHLVGYDFDHAVAMDRTSTTTSTACTWVTDRSGPSIFWVDPHTPDPDFEPAWETMSSVPVPMADGGALIEAGDRLYAMPGGANATKVYEYDVTGDSWSLRNTSPYDHIDYGQVTGLDTGKLAAPGAPTVPLTNGTVYAVVEHDGKLILGGDFASVWTHPVGALYSLPNLAVWDPAAETWSSVGAPNGPVYALAVLDDILFVGGDFGQVTVDGSTVNAQNLYRYDLAAGSAAQNRIVGTDGPVHSLDTEVFWHGYSGVTWNWNVYPDAHSYVLHRCELVLVGGDFSQATYIRGGNQNVTANNVALWWDNGSPAGETECDDINGRGDSVCRDYIGRYREFTALVDSATADNGTDGIVYAGELIPDEVQEWGPPGGVGAQDGDYVRCTLRAYLGGAFTTPDPRFTIHKARYYSSGESSAFNDHYASDPNGPVYDIEDPYRDDDRESEFSWVPAVMVAGAFTNVGNRLANWGRTYGGYGWTNRGGGLTDIAYDMEAPGVTTQYVATASAGGLYKCSSGACSRISRALSGAGRGITASWVGGTIESVSTMGAGLARYDDRGAYVTGFYTKGANGPWRHPVTAHDMALSTVALAGGTSDYIYMVADVAGSYGPHRYNLTTGALTERTLVGAPGDNAALVYVPIAGEAEDDGDLYILRQAAGHDFYRYDMSAGAWQVKADFPATAAAGSALAYDPGGGGYLYALAGGGDNHLYRYSMAANSWETQSLPAMARDGAGLAVREGYLYVTMGQNASFYRYGPLHNSPEKLHLADTALVAKTTVATPYWYSAAAADAHDDFHVTLAGDNAWVRDVAWSPTAPSRLSVAAAQFVDADQDVYRLGSGSALDAGYAPPTGEAYVSPDYCNGCDNDGRTWGETAFDRIQDAIDHGAARVLLKPGVYEEAIYAVSGLALLGSGAESTVIKAPTGLTGGPLIRAEGVAAVTVGNVTLDGDGRADGLRVEDGARDITVARCIIRDADTAIAIDGADTALEIVNNTLVNNTDGVAATGCARVDMRNTILSDHGGDALSYQRDTCTSEPGHVHRYNDYWHNGNDLVIDGAAASQPGTGEIMANPRFRDPGVDDYRLWDTSPAIDAGNPSDPAPPGTGDRVDMGYAEMGGAALSVDDDYCATCLNDGLTWGVNAFGVIQDALDAAEDRVAALGDALTGKLTVGVGPGTYQERVTVPSYVRLIGADADQVTIDGQYGGHVISVNDATDVEIRGLRIINANTQSAGIRVTNGSRRVMIRRNVIENNQVGVGFYGQSTGRVFFNTIVGCSYGVRAEGASTWAKVRNNILADHTIALVSANDGQLFSDYNLLYANTNHYQDTLSGPHDLVAAPQFVGGGTTPYHLQPTSPAVDSAAPGVDPPVGGGERADRGYHELLAAPLALLFGQEGPSCAEGNSGVLGSEIGWVRVTDAGQPVTATLPASWTAATLETPNDVASYWSATWTPAQDGLHRIYTRAKDLAGNQESDPADWYAGACLLDGTAPTVAWVAPSGNPTTSDIAMTLQATADDWIHDGEAKRFMIDDVYFIVNGQRYDGDWVDDGWTEAGGDPRAFEALAPLAQGANDLYAVAVDAAGNETTSALRTVTSTTAGDAAAITSLRDGTKVRDGTLELAGVARYTTASGTGHVGIAVDGGTPVAATLDDTAATFTTWTATVTVAGQGMHTLVATAWRTGTTSSRRLTSRGVNLGAGSSVEVTLDTTPPSLSIDAPLAGQLVTETVAFQGTATDAGAGATGVASVQVSLDGGVTWADAQRAGDDWTYEWTAPSGEAGVTYTALVVATDGAGNETAATRTVIVDQAPPEGLLPLTFNVAPGTHLDAVTDLVAQWTEAVDGSGAVTITVAVDQIADTVPTTVDNDLTHSASLNANGAWYFHIMARDGAGNGILYHRGPWYLGLNQGVACAAKTQSIILDGALDVAAGEWLTATEWLDTDERANPAASLYAALAGDGVYAGWRGDGILWLYMDTAGGGGNSTVPSGAPLPFDADLALQVTDTLEARLWAYAGGWSDGPLADYAGSGTAFEGFVPLDLTAVSDLRWFAVVLDHDGNPVALFPTTNTPAGAWTDAYHWADPCNTGDLNDGQPTAATVALTLSAREAALPAWGNNMDVTYDVRMENKETVTLSGHQLNLGATTGLGLQSLLSGGTCTSCPAGGDAWTVALPDLTAGGVHTVTVAARTAASLGAATRVTATAHIPTTGYPAVSSGHRTDGVPPTVGVDTAPLQVIRSGAQTVTGWAEDGLTGSGVALVEVMPEGGSWTAALGRGAWALDVNVPSQATFTVQVRAADDAGNVSDPVTQVFTVDDVPPLAGMDVPPVVSGQYAVFHGNGRDLYPDGGRLVRAEVQINPGSGSPWMLASGPYAPRGSLSVQDFTYTWALPREDGQLYYLMAQVTDAAGNTGPSQIYSTTVDTVPPVVTPTQQVAVTDCLTYAPGAVNPPPVLTGQVSDGGGLGEIRVYVTAPAGEVLTQTATLGGGSWHFAPELDPSIVGTYTLQIEAFDAAGNGALYGEPFDLRIKDVPIAGLAAANDGPTPLGAETTLTATLSAGTNVSYLWDFGDGHTITGPRVQRLYTAYGTYTATVTATNTESTAVAHTVVVVDESIAALSATNDSPTLIGHPTTLEAQITAGSRVSYAWAYGDGATGTGSQQAHTYPAVGEYTAWVTASNSVGLMTDTTTVVVNPAGALTSTVRSDLLCAGWTALIDITYENIMGTPPADATLVITVPAGTQVVHAASSAGLADPGPWPGTVAWDVGWMEPGTRVTYTLALHLVSTLANGTQVAAPVAAHALGADAIPAPVTLTVRADGPCLGPTPTATSTPTPTPSTTPTGQQAVKIMSDCDTTLDSHRPDTPLADQPVLSVTGTGSKRALVRFDLGMIPGGAAVEDAELRLVTDGGGSLTAPLMVYAYEVLCPWAVAEATWLEAADGMPWGVPGADAPGSDRAAAPCAETQVADRQRAAYTWDVTALAQRWVDDPAANQGLLLMAPGGATARFNFLACEADVADAMKPHLVVRYRYEPVTATPSATWTPTPTGTRTPKPTMTPTPTRRATWTPTATGPAVGVVHLPLVCK